MTEKVLLVDDDVNLLRDLRRQLSKRFDITIAEGGQQALGLIKSDGPFAVVISDMKMPGMNGIETFAAIKDDFPDTVRMILTGNADQRTAIETINRGNIFMFFNKPCPVEILAEGIEAGLHQYGLITAEKDILEKTLGGSMKLMMDVLSMVDPEIFGISNKLRNWAKLVSKDLGVAPQWKLEIAATLSPIGQIAVPKELRDKNLTGNKLTTEELEIISMVPENGRKLIGNIPRLKLVADIVYYQSKSFDGSGFPTDGISGEEIPRESRILKILIDLAVVSKGSKPTIEEFDILDKRRAIYDPELLKKIKVSLCVASTPPVSAEKPKVELESETQSEFSTTESSQLKPAIKEMEASKNLIPLSRIRAGHILKSNIEHEDGRLILAAGVKVTLPQVELLKNQMKMKKLTDPIEVEDLEPELEK